MNVILVSPKISANQSNSPAKKRLRKDADLGHIIHKFHKTEGSSATLSQLNQKIKTDNVEQFE